MRLRKADWLVVIFAPLGFLLLEAFVPPVYAALYAVGIIVLYVTLSAHRHDSQHRELSWSTLGEYAVVGLLAAYLYLSVL